MSTIRPSRVPLKAVVEACQEEAECFRVVGDACMIPHDVIEDNVDRVFSEWRSAYRGMTTSF